MPDIRKIIVNDDLNVVHDQVNLVVDKLDSFTFAYNDANPPANTDIFNVDRFIQYNEKLKAQMENIKLDRYDEVETESYFLTLILD